MKKDLLRYLGMSLLFFMLIPLSCFAYGTKSDSIRLDRQADKFYIVHKVDPRETLFSLSRRYEVSIEDILVNNPEAREGLKVESILKIPHNKKSNPDRQKGRTHTVKNGETLFSISREYNTGIDEVAQANELEGYAIKVGQQLIIPDNDAENAAAEQAIKETGRYHVVDKGETLFSISRKYRTKPDQLKAWNDLESADLQIGQRLFVQEPESQPVFAAANDQADSEPVIRNPTPVGDAGLSASANPPAIKKYKIEDNQYEKKKADLTEKAGQAAKIEKVYETGLAEAIEGAGDTKKYLALHKTAPPGSILQVRNEMNDLTVFVRVIGKLPDTGENKKILIKMSKIAYEHLGAIDERFPVEISYIP